MTVIEEGVEVALDDHREWSALSPIKGHVLEVHLPSTSMADPPDAWAAFVILQVANRLDGSLVLRVKHLGAEDKPIALALDLQFNQQERSIHLCLSQPCIDVGGEGQELPPHTLHVTRVRLWSLAGFGAVQDYIEEGRLNEAAKWIKVKERVPKAKAGPRRETPARKERKPRAPKAKDKAEKPPKGGRPREEPKMSEKERTALRNKLQDIRRRLQGAETPGKKDAEDEKSSPQVLSDEEDVSDGYSAESFASALGDAKLTTGMELGDMAAELAKAEARQRKKRKQKGGDHIDPRDAQLVLKESTLKGLSGQLLQKAVEVTRSQKKRKKKQEQKHQTDAQKLTDVLSKILTRSSQGKKDAKKKRKKRHKKLQDGTIVSYSGSSGSSSPEPAEEETSESDIEAPLRKKSRDHPGSVLNMLVAHVRSQLEEGAVTEVSSSKNQVTGGVKIMSYFNLHIKGSYPLHLRELRELHHLAASLDLVRTGDIARAADALSARFIALHQALVDGSWGTAKHMELYPLEEVSAAGHAAVLATRKHAKLVAKVQGADSGSWSSSWPRAGKGWKGKGDWGSSDQRSDGRGETKGKGKGKKGRGKWDQWDNRPKRDWSKDKEKTEEKPKA